MTKVINGARYDTDRAHRLARWERDTNDSADHMTETLYRTKAGKFFIHGEGGPNTRYASRSGGSGEKIVPLTESDAREWAEFRLDAKERARIASMIVGVTDTVRVKISADISVDVKARIDQIRADVGLRTVADVIEAAVMAYKPEDN